MEDKSYEKRLQEREKRRELRRKAVIRQRILFGCVLGIILILSIALGAITISNKKEESRKKEAKKQAEEAQKRKEQEEVSLTISAAGDCTLGTDEYFAYDTGFTGKYDAVQNPGYFFEKVKPVFAEDDLTIVNMEGTLTLEETRAEKQFAFKADPSYAKILTEGSVEAANLANNHSKDYGEKSYTDTIEALEKEGITSFGYDRTAVMEVKGVKVGLAGVYELADNMGCEDDMIANIENLKEQDAQIIIVSFHWGLERENIPNSTQIALAHSAVDHGADLVLGHHPHVLQGIEEYKGKNIVYSLGNFCFGGNSGPEDMDTMIFQQIFTVKGGKLQEDNVTNLIPCKISSSYASGVNDYQPMPAEGEEKDAILARIQEYSSEIPEAEGSEE